MNALVDQGAQAMTQGRRKEAIAILLMGADQAITPPTKA